MIKDLMKIFSGLNRAYGTYTINKDNKGAKQKGKALTIEKSVTEEVWAKHINGKKGIGIVPIKDNNKVSWGCIDIDIYGDFDHENFVLKIEKQGWPLIVCRTKSGGAHVFLFTSEEVSAKLMREKLSLWAVALGHPGAEIFPKQDVLESKEDIGNWLNMPYFNANRTTRYGFRNGKALELKDFIEYVLETAVSKRDLVDWEIKTGDFGDAPPCLERLIIQGFPEGSMNNALFNMGVYARMKHADDWERYVYDYNEDYMGPGSPSEVKQIIKSLSKKKYIYKCNEDPLCGYCNKAICGQRKFGISSEHLPYKTTAGQKQHRPCILDEVESPVTCFLPPDDSDDEPNWSFKIHDQQMFVDIDMIQSQRLFLRGYLKKFRKVILSIDENRWAIAINSLLEEANNVDMAADAGPEGQLRIHLENFCTGKVQAREHDELALGKPWLDTEGEEGPVGRIWFRSQDLMKYLDTQRFRSFKINDLYPILRRWGATHKKFMIKGKCVACWSVSGFNKMESDFKVPEIDDGDY